MHIEYEFDLLSGRRQEIAEITPKSVTQGDAITTNGEKHLATYAVDNDLSTSAATNTDGAGWIKLEFDKTYFIHKVVIYYRFYTNWYDPSDKCVQSEADFRGCVDNDNNVDVSVYQGDEKQKSCGTLKLTDRLEQTNHVYKLLCNIKGDIVKLTKTSGVIIVYEVAVTTTGIAYFSN